MPTKLEHLQDHCQAFVDQLDGCATPEQARQLKQRVCTQLHETCQSEILIELLDEHTDQLIRERFR
jgi:hypothetical protein